MEPTGLFFHLLEDIMTKVAGSISSDKKVNRVPEEIISRYIELNEKRITYKAISNQVEAEYNQLIQHIQKTYGTKINLILEAENVDTSKEDSK
jgi:hypothetical protein